MMFYKQRVYPQNYKRLQLQLAQRCLQCCGLNFDHWFAWDTSPSFMEGPNYRYVSLEFVLAVTLMSICTERVMLSMYQRVHNGLFFALCKERLCNFFRELLWFVSNISGKGNERKRTWKEAFGFGAKNVEERFNRAMRRWTLHKDDDLAWRWRRRRRRSNPNKVLNW